MKEMTTILIHILASFAAASVSVHFEIARGLIRKIVMPVSGVFRLTKELCIVCLIFSQIIKRCNFFTLFGLVFFCNFFTLEFKLFPILHVIWCLSYITWGKRITVWQIVVDAKMCNDFCRGKKICEQRWLATVKIASFNHSKTCETHSTTSVK